MERLKYQLIKGFRKLAEKEAKGKNIEKELSHLANLLEFTLTSELEELNQIEKEIKEARENILKLLEEFKELKKEIKKEGK